MGAVASLVRVPGWGEGLKQTLISVGTTAEKIDTLGATRVLITVLTQAKLLFVSPDDVGTTDAGIALFLNSSTSARNEPMSLEIKLDGNPELWVRSSSGTTDISVIHFFDSNQLLTDRGESSTLRIKHWDEEVKHTQLVAPFTSWIKVDPLGASRLLIMPIDAGLRLHVSPTNEGATSAGVILIRDNTTAARNEPYALELDINGNAPVFLKSSSGANIDVSVFHFDR